MSISEMTMRALAWLTLLLAATAVGRTVVAQEAAGALEARVWLDRGDEPVLRRGEDVRVYYRTGEDAFAAIFRIDTDGRVSLIYPQHPDAADLVRGRRDYRLLFPHAPAWRVDEDPGVGYLFIVASPEPLDFSRFPFDERYGWDLSGVGEAVYSDPYVAIDDYVAQIVPAWDQVPYALDFVTYSVGETHSYPRFLCYDCHAFQRYSSWNPYDYTCETYRVVIWDDPYFYPRYRYSGMNLVVARPVRALPRYEVARRSVGDAVAPIVRVRSPAERRVAEYKEPAAAAASNAGTPPVRRSASALASPQERPRTGVAPQQVPDTARTRPTLQRRPSARLPSRTPPAARGTPAEQPRPTPVPPKPTSPRAPTTRPQAAPREPQAAPTPTRPVRTPPTSRGARTPEPQAAPTRTPTRPTTTREPQAAPSRPSVRSVPSRPSGQPAVSPRPQSAPRPETPRAGSGTSRPSASPPPSRPNSSPPAASARPPARTAEPRPTVRPRPTEPN